MLRRQFLKEMKKSSTSIESLLNNLLAWSGTHLGKIHVRTEKFNLNTVIEETIKVVSSKALEKKINFVFERKDLQEITSDKFMVETIIRNLLTNALKFSYNGSSVNIMVNKIDEEVEIAIQDFGLGMNETKIESIRKQVSIKSTYGTQNESGTGLGLAICFEFINMIKGRLDVVSREGEGTIFSVIIPNL